MTETHTCDWHDVQGLVLRGYKHLMFAECLILRFHDHRSGYLWLQQAVKRVSRGDEGPSPTACAIALSHSGLLKAAGFDDGSGAALRFFSREFSEGMSGASHRSRILGDSGLSHPMTWQWGGPHDPVDALVFLCAGSQAALEELRRSVVPAAAAHGSATSITLTDLHEAEHFGFRDGMSQPILEGTRLALERPDSHHIVKLGEMLLGYPDNGGFVAPVPWVLDNKEFGKNGTYLVCRQLEQDVAGFHKFARRAAKISGQDGAAGAEFVKAKMLGRWPGGAPLLPPGATDSHHDDNEFGFFEHDRQGLACPIGAHIRRANPRDTLESEDKDRWKASNRHRILRRGRSYGPHWRPDEKEAVQRGLLFVGLNGDIERQFEFIQHNWLNDPAFGGLFGESDPVVGDDPAGEGNASPLRHLAEQAPASGGPPALRTGRKLTMPGFPARRRQTDLQRFVTTRGGEYFFLPGLRALEFLVSVSKSHAKRPSPQ
jgi:Dyp-type peroxidase family